MTNNNHRQNTQQKVKRVIILMFFLTVLPILLAVLFYLNPHWISHRKNYGTLITPPVQLNKADLIPLGSFSSKHFSELNDHWVLIHVVPEVDGDCNEICIQSIQKSHQLWLMLNQNLMRLRRLVLFSNAGTGSRVMSKINDPYLLYAVGKETLFDRLSSVLPAPIAGGTVVLRDPLGNVMLWYRPDFDPYKVKKDLSRLFRTSRVG